MRRSQDAEASDAVGDIRNMDLRTAVAALPYFAARISRMRKAEILRRLASDSGAAQVRQMLDASPVTGPCEVAVAAAVADADALVEIWAQDLGFGGVAGLLATGFGGIILYLAFVSLAGTILVRTVPGCGLPFAVVNGFLQFGATVEMNSLQLDTPLRLTYRDKMLTTANGKVSKIGAFLDANYGQRAIFEFLFNIMEIERVGASGNGVLNWQNLEWGSKLAPITSTAQPSHGWFGFFLPMMNDGWVFSGASAASARVDTLLDNKELKPGDYVINVNPFGLGMAKDAEAKNDFDIWQQNDAAFRLGVKWPPEDPSKPGKAIPIEQVPDPVANLASGLWSAFKDSEDYDLGLHLLSGSATEAELQQFQRVFEYGLLQFMDAVVQKPDLRGFVIEVTPPLVEAGGEIATSVATKFNAATYKHVLKLGTWCRTVGRIVGAWLRARKASLSSLAAGSPKIVFRFASEMTLGPKIGYGLSDSGASPNAQEYKAAFAFLRAQILGGAAAAKAPGTTPLSSEYIQFACIPHARNSQNQAVTSAQIVALLPDSPQLDYVGADLYRNDAFETLAALQNILKAAKQKGYPANLPILVPETGMEVHSNTAGVTHSRSYFIRAIYDGVRAILVDHANTKVPPASVGFDKGVLLVKDNPAAMSAAVLMYFDVNKINVGEGLDFSLSPAQQPDPKSGSLAVVSSNAPGESIEHAREAYMRAVTGISWMEFVIAVDSGQQEKLSTWLETLHDYMVKQYESLGAIP